MAFAQDPGVVLLVAVALLFGGLVKGLVGIGLPIVSLGILSSVLDVRLALGLIVIPILVTNLWQAWYAGQPLRVVRRFWPLLTAMLACVWIGTHLLVRLPGDVLYGVIGAGVALFTVVSYATPMWTLPARAQVWAGPLAGAVSGLLGGISTIWGPPLVMYFVMIRLSKDDFIRATGLIWFVASVPLLLGFIRNGILGPAEAQISAAACVPSFIGLWAGQWLRNRISPERFRNVLLFVFFLIGLNLVRRAIF